MAGLPVRVFEHQPSPYSSVGDDPIRCATVTDHPMGGAVCVGTTPAV